MFMRFHMQVIVQSDLVIYCDLLGVRLLWGAIETYIHTSHIITFSRHQNELGAATAFALRSAPCAQQLPR